MADEAFLVPGALGGSARSKPSPKRKMFRVRLRESGSSGLRETTDIWRVHAAELKEERLGRPERKVIGRTEAFLYTLR
jgi:hypothetical protein